MVGHVEHRIDGAVSRSLGLGPIPDAPRPVLQGDGAGAPTRLRAHRLFVVAS
jgi:hypothetical protein